jgi:hypothetical protein
MPNLAHDLIKGAVLDVCTRSVTAPGHGDASPKLMAEQIRGLWGRSMWSWRRIPARWIGPPLRKVFAGISSKY